ncbi:hypothetical protein [Tenacibaculum finnmarkense]|uniref:Membrane or secreted protein n=1 Tax=Tenacibaculum finnmarkense genomovar ulcerans TaxID=2781388 RepID=A0A2I2MAL9_9FLAO|nr:hypothetical protein [Tenacibaculum finnmarkense]MBE7696397.1 hypothetical protein [Tenacibaculum finnmarkense genomovar ulcerans]MCD8421758.1 hypothetical protein [Tenacibaculum finnmarkense genomovar ulcerans]MCG8237885.1 hypothetical protein [Tenacibaculum finnmarkense genomovar ulcerans]MCG8807054.1 hypothetical protein [Tenacibaculum finnmarkense]MCG8817294.1 hypothetical protein [Tenacibaculum finnmarkense]
MKNFKKFTVLFALFIVPLLFYILLQLGTHNFGKLPIVSKSVIDISLIDKSISFDRRVSVVTFLGNDIALAKGEVYNLKEKIYNKFSNYVSFQMISLVDKSQKEEIEALKKMLSVNTDLSRWDFIFASSEEMQALHESFKTPNLLDKNIHSPKAYIIDKELNLRRGKSTIKSLENENLFGYTMSSVAELKNDMIDDISVVLVEYKMALKKNNSSDDRRKNSISNEKK